MKMEREIMTHLKYIRETQEENKKNIEKLFDKIDKFPERMAKQVLACDQKFDNINLEVSKAKGFLAGVIFVAGAIGAGISYVVSLLFK